MSGIGGGDPSFDPRTWGRRADAKTRRSAKRPPGKKKSHLPVAIIGGAVLAIAAGGGFLVWRSHGKPPSAPQAAPFAGAFRRSLSVSDLSELPAVLTAEGLSSAVAGQIATVAAQAAPVSADTWRVVLNLSPGTPPTFRDMELHRPDGSGVVIRQTAPGQFAAQPLASDLQVRIKVVRGEIDANTFYSSAVAAGVVDALVADFANAFTFDFDFQREIQPGDIFEAAFEQSVDSTGQVVGAERLVYASLQTQTKSRALYLYKPSDGSQAGWFDGNGQSIVRGLMRTPVEGARISSGFGSRFHPVLGYTRMHKGTDFAVPVGTTVYASGDGVVDFVGPHGGHGNFVRIRHNSGLQTGYAHLSSYGPGITVGAAVHQGQAIALSGNTGLSSGPHLHYEVTVNNEQVDPMTYETTSGHSLQGQALADFRKERDRIDALRAAQNG